MIINYPPMSHICYAYIYKYKALHDVELTFDAHFAFHFDKETRTLQIESSNTLPRDFWGNGIYSLSGLIGDNGTGKSTALCFLLDALVNGSSKKEANGIIVYEENGRLFIYHNEKYGRITCVGADVTPTKLRKINTFYYSGHFFPYTSGDDLRCFELDGSYIASDGCRLVNDAEDYLKVEALNLSRPLWYHLNAFVVQNNFRICSLLADTRLVKSFTEFKLPRKVLVTVNKSGKQAFEVENINKKEEEQYHLPYEKIVTRKGLGVIEEWLIYHNLVNAMRDIYRRDRVRNLLDEWLEIVTDDKDILGQFASFVDEKEDNDDELILSDILTSLRSLVSLAHYNEELSVFYFDIFDDEENFKKFVSEVFGTRHFVVNRFADFSFCHSLDDEGSTILSSGEQQMLNLFSRIYNAVEGKPRKPDNRYPTPLLLLDEAETGFHPEWQRRYIHLIIGFLSKLMVPPGFNFQIIITSHSPILLSDIPSCCTNRLRIEGETNNEISTNTYASNVFDIYRDYLTTNGGLIGEFASKRLVEMQKKLEEKQLDEDTIMECKKEIELVGDARIRAYLMKLLSNHNKQIAIDYYQRQITRLKQNEQD